MSSDRQRNSLKGLSLEKLKQSTTTSSPPVLVAQDRRSSQVSDRLSLLILEDRDISPLLLQTTCAVTTPPTTNFTFTASTTNLKPSLSQTSLRFSAPESSPRSFDFSFPSMVRQQESSQVPPASAVASNHPPAGPTKIQEPKAPSSPVTFQKTHSEQHVPSPQPLFGRPTQLGGASQPFARHQPLQRSSNGGSQQQLGPGARKSDGNNHLFISNKSGNRRPDFFRPQQLQPTQSIHKPPSGGNPLSQMSAASNTQDSSHRQKPRPTRVIDSSDDEDFVEVPKPANSPVRQPKSFTEDDDVYEISKPANFPTWQPKAFAHPTFSSSHSVNPFVQPKPSTTTMMSRNTLVANTVADGGIWDDRYNMADPSIYLDSGKANEELKALFEGSVEDEDEDDKPRTRRGKKQLDAKADDLADKMRSLGVKTDPEKQETEEAENEEDEEDEDDGTLEGLKVKLLPHQREGVDWMATKERGKGKGKGMTKGGILADDMGLGKTIQSIALMLTNKPPATENEKSKSDITYSKCTLIIAPLALIKQWEGELKDRIEPSHAFKICVHHGPQRAKSYKDLLRYDIVITTYQTLSSEHAACSDKIRAGCLGVNWYRVILDEAHSIKNRSAKVTKAACALEAKYRWCLTGTPMQNNLDELQSLIAFLKIGPLDKYDYWKSRIIQPINSGRGGLAIKRLQTALKSIMKRRTKDVLKLDGALKNGESDKSETSNNAGFKIVKRTVEKIEAEFTREERAFYTRLESRIDEKLEKMKAGTNKVSYANALVLLLRLRQACNHAKLLGFDLAGERDALGDGLQTPRKKGGDNVDDITAMFGGLNVEMKECDICQAELSKQEIDNGSIRCRACEEDLTSQANIQKPRQATLKKLKYIVKNDRNIKRRVIIDSDDDEEEDRDDSNITTKSKTVHLNHPSDNEEDQDEDYSEESDDDDGDEEEANLVASTKIRHLISILRTDNHTHKYIIFSFFTSMLDLIEPFLSEHHISYVRYDGSMRNDAREASLHSLRSNPTTRVLLCSLRAGSLGLNLTAASRVIILEPFWNPFVEEQAIDRVHRLNQTQDVIVYKLTIKDTVEARILELQEKKRELARVTVEGGAGAGGQGVAKLTLAEMMNLFEHASEEGATVDMLGMKGGKLLGDRNGGGNGEEGWGESTEERYVYDAGERSGLKAKKTGNGNGARREHEVYGRRW